MSLILSGTDGLSDVDGSAATPAIRGTDANTGIFFPAADTIGFSEGGAEVARFDSSGNFGIGTTTPDALLHAYKTSGKVATFGNNVNNNGNYIVLGGSVSNKNWVLSNNMIVGGEFGIGRTSANGGTTIGSAHDLTIDQSGNVTMAGTLGVTGKVTKASMPTGSVLQVVSVGYGTQALSTSTTYADTGLSASITPSSTNNKILVIVSQGLQAIGGGAVGYGYQINAGIQLLRGATALITPSSDSGGKYTAGIGTGVAPASGNIVIVTIVGMNYLDSPATTSSTTYKTQFAKGAASMNAVYVNDSSTYITLMEIAG